MGASKCTFMEVRIQAEMSEDSYKAIPDHLKEEMTIKRIDMPNYKELYKQDAEWRHRNDTFVEALMHKQEREAELRINNQNK